MPGIRTKKSERRGQTLDNEKLIEMYNNRFEIEEELDILENLKIMDERKRIKQLNIQLSYIDNIISIGETNYTKKRHINVRRLFSVLKTLQEKE
uniref:Transposase n=1 Tax=Caenorhabditis tropicalis TaxID=1561998 RepID=A0A1I7UEZ5_9PELO